MEGKQRPEKEVLLEVCEQRGVKTRAILKLNLGKLSIKLHCSSSFKLINLEGRGGKYGPTCSQAEVDISVFGPFSW